MWARRNGYFRVTDHDPAIPQDFASDAESGKGPEQPPFDREGRSVYVDFTAAVNFAERVKRARARDGLPPAPIFIAFVPDDAGPLHAEQRGKNRHHFQLWGRKEELAALAETVWCLLP